LKLKAVLKVDAAFDTAFFFYDIPISRAGFIWLISKSLMLKR